MSRLGRPRLPSGERGKVFSIRLPARTLGEVRREALDRGEQPTALVRRWITERLDRERVSSEARVGEPPAPYGAQDARAGPTLSALRRMRTSIIETAAKHGGSNVRVFGSVARGDARSDSDVDFLIDIEPERSLFDVVRLNSALEELLGRPVDVAEADDLRDHVRGEALREAVPL